MGNRYRSIGALSGLLLLLAVTANAGNEAAPDLNKVISLMVQAQAQNRAQHTAYEVVRSYRIYKPEESSQKPSVIALVSFAPPHLKTFKIEESSGGIAERVVRNALQHEVELTKDPTQSDYNPQNYNFTLMGREVVDGNLCYVLGLEPKRESKDLLRGKAWVDAKSFLIHRVEGQPSKGLSWWIHDVHITLMYNNVNGMWLRTASQATASVRFKGDVNFSSRDVDFRPVEDVAAITPLPAPAPGFTPAYVSEKPSHVVRRPHRTVLPRNENGGSK